MRIFPRRHIPPALRCWCDGFFQRIETTSAHHILDSLSRWYSLSLSLSVYPFDTFLVKKRVFPFSLLAFQRRWVTREQSYSLRCYVRLLSLLNLRLLLLLLLQCFSMPHFATTSSRKKNTKLEKSILWVQLYFLQSDLNRSCDIASDRRWPRGCMRETAKFVCLDAKRNSASALVQWTAIERANLRCCHFRLERNRRLSCFRYEEKREGKLYVSDFFRFLFSLARAVVLSETGDVLSSFAANYRLPAVRAELSLAPSHVIMRLMCGEVKPSEEKDQEKRAREEKRTE